MAHLIFPLMSHLLFGFGPNAFKLGLCPTWNDGTVEYCHKINDHEYLLLGPFRKQITEHSLWEKHHADDEKHAQNQDPVIGQQIR